VPDDRPPAVPQPGRDVPELAVADWFRFMKSMSISAHGSARLCWVCRCRSGWCSVVRPEIHIFAGEKVCIQAMTPTHRGSAFASRHTRRIASGVVNTGLAVTLDGMAEDASSSRTIRDDCSSTFRSVCSP
jgi:hypothetical protein